MEPCPYVCKHSEPTSTAYTGDKCGCTQCPNFPICKVWASPTFFEQCNGRCGYCEAVFAKNLRFHHRITECTVCLEDEPVLVEHPAGCGHTLCVTCIRILFAESGNPYPKPTATAYGYTTKCKCNACTDDHPCGQELAVWQSNNPVACYAYVEAEVAREQRWVAELRQDKANRYLCPTCRKDTRNTYMILAQVSATRPVTNCTNSECIIIRYNM